MESESESELELDWEPELVSEFEWRMSSFQRWTTVGFSLLAMAYRWPIWFGLVLM